MSTATDMQNLYRHTVLEHSRHPRNFRQIEDADRSAEGHNPLCGDKVSVYLRLSNDSIDDIAFEGIGCAIALASASIMTKQIEHQTTQQARQSVATMIARFTDRTSQELPAGDMAALGGVRAYPSRVKCATLAWKTLEAALDGDAARATTEE